MRETNLKTENHWLLIDIVDPDGVKYNCCEQYMMYKKALLFNDVDIANEIKLEPSPLRQKELGRKIKGFDPEIWDNNKLGIVWYGNFLKFSQHSDLKERLLLTGDRILAEASPIDLIWGVGLKSFDDNILDIKNWKGKNLLGEVLMSIRDILKK